MAQHDLEVAASPNRHQTLCIPIKPTVAPATHEKKSSLPEKQTDDEEEHDDGYDEDEEEENDESYQSEHSSSEELLADSSSSVVSAAHIEQITRTIRETMPQDEREKQEHRTEDAIEYFHKMFKMPTSEKLVEDFYCAYYGRMLYQGRM